MVEIGNEECRNNQIAPVTPRKNSREYRVVPMTPREVTRSAVRYQIAPVTPSI